MTGGNHIWQSTAVEHYIHNGRFILKKLNEHNIGKEKGEAKILEKIFYCQGLV